jgi:hypothetical protein
MRKIEKKLLLEATKGGLAFYEFALGKLVPESPNRMKNVLNPFYDDSVASLSIYRKMNQETMMSNWLYNDFGESSISEDTIYSGDVFDFASHYYDLSTKDDFPKIMEMIVVDLKIDLESVTYSDDFFSSNYYRTGFEIVDYKSTIKRIHTDSFFQKKYSIPWSICCEYNTFAIKGYYRFHEDRKDDKYFVHDEEFLIAFKDDDYAKIYHPKNPNRMDSSRRFYSLGKKPENFIFGWKQIQNRVIKTERPRDILIITGGEKDVMSLATLGYDAITFNSETCEIPKYAIDNIFPSFDKVIIMYDNDNTGVKKMDALCKRHKLWRVILPESIQGKRIKDISDCMKFKIDRSILDEMIANAECPYQDVEPIETTIEILPSSVKSNSVEPQNNLLIDSIDKDLAAQLIPKSVYENLPSYLKEICELFDDERTKDLVLLSSLTVLSTCFPKVEGIYFHDTVGTNLYLFITAPPASGKGTAKWSRKLIQGIESTLKERHRKALVQYQTDSASYAKRVVDEPDLEKPDEPLQQAMIISADSSSTKMIETLGDNGDFGLIFETEGDVVSKALKSDWSDYSTTLRQAFHHEAISIARKSGRGLYCVESPHLSVFLAGTLKQVPDLIKSVENGLMSRFLFYKFDGESEFRDPFENCVDYNPHFQKFSEELLSWWLTMENLSETCLVSLTSEQRLKFRPFFRDHAKSLNQLFGNDIDASVKRMGLCHFRICMILTAIRQMESHMNLQARMTVNDVDFNIATEIIETLIQHMTVVFSQLFEGGNNQNNLKFRQKRLLESLPNEFTWEQCKELAKTLNIPTVTAGGYLRKFKEQKLLVNVKQGYYQKL